VDETCPLRYLAESGKSISAKIRHRMKAVIRKFKAISALHLDLFKAESITPPPPATIYAKIKEYALPPKAISISAPAVARAELPSISELHDLFDRLNMLFFDGALPKQRIEYSDRMMMAGSYTPSRKLIKIGRRYHDVFPDEFEDTLKHEMIHIIHLRHNTAFKKEAARVGTSLRANFHPSLRKPPRYTYVCGNCKREFPRQKQFRMASCGRCSVGRRFDPRFKLTLKSNHKKA